MNMPRIQAAFSNWTSGITLIRRTQSVVDGLTVFTDSKIPFRGVVQPLSPKLLMLKPEGERAFQWLQIHCAAKCIKLDVADQIVFNKMKYKIMLQNDYSLDGYMEYHACQYYQP